MMTNYNTQQINELEKIEDYIGRLVDLTQKGKTLKGCCPFHNSTSGSSFVVFPDTQSWRCFGACHEGGDRIKFHMKNFNLDFKDACEDLSKGHVLSDDYKPKPIPKRPTTNPSFYSAKTEYDVAMRSTGNEYTERKQIPVEILQELQARQAGDKILIPMFGGGKIKGFQDIQPSRDYLPEKITRGNTASAILGTLKNGVPILLGEGLATCISAYMAMESIPTVIAFNSNRLELVAKVLRNRYPDSQVVILVDVDLSLTGQKVASKIMANVDRIDAITPLDRMPDDWKSKSFDFSDLHLSDGLDAVYQRINKNITCPPCGSGACKPDGDSKVIEHGKLGCTNCGGCYAEIPYGVNVLNRRYENETTN